MAEAEAAGKRVQTFGRKRNAVAVAQCTKGQGIIRVNGKPLELAGIPELRVKAFEPLLILGANKFAQIDMRIRVRGGGQASQIYAVRQAIAKGVIAFYQKNVDEVSRKALKDQLMAYDRSLLVADPRRCEPKKFGGRGARARRQKSYR